MELAHNADQLYVANAGSNDVTIVDTSSDQSIKTVSTGKRPLDGVGSGKVVRCGHSTQSHPETIEEVRRILREPVGEK